jgi:hypothetical protein
MENERQIRILSEALSRDLNHGGLAENETSTDESIETRAYQVSQEEPRTDAEKGRSTKTDPKPSEGKTTLIAERNSIQISESPLGACEGGSFARVGHIRYNITVPMLPAGRECKVSVSSAR